MLSVLFAKRSPARLIPGIWGSSKTSRPGPTSRLSFVEWRYCFRALPEARTRIVGATPRIVHLVKIAVVHGIVGRRAVVGLAMAAHRAYGRLHLEPRRAPLAQGALRSRLTFGSARRRLATGRTRTGGMRRAVHSGRSLNDGGVRGASRGESIRISGVLCGSEQRRDWLKDRVEGQRR